MKTFHVVHGKFDGRLHRGIRCLVCRRTSWNRNDVKNEYCGGCHQYHSIMAADPQVRAQLLGEKATEAEARTRWWQ